MSKCTMEYVQLGKSGLKVSKVIFGAMSLGSPTQAMGWTIPQEEAIPILKHAYDLGINTFDTADVYSNGDSEKIFGAFLRTHRIPRQKVVLMTKCYAGVCTAEETEGLDENERLRAMSVNDGAMVNRVGLSRKHIFDAVDSSIERLGTYIDVLQIHRLDRETPREEIMRALNDVVESGKVRYIGACTMAAWEFQSLQNIAKQHGWHQFISMQDYHSLLYREPEREMIPYCFDTGVGVIPYSPLARGLLARPQGSERTKRQKTDTYSEYLIGKTTDADVEIIRRVEELAKKKEVSMAIIVMAWCFKKGVVPIVGLASKERVDEAAASVTIAKKGLLGEEDVKFLEEKYIAKSVVGLQ